MHRRLGRRSVRLPGHGYMDGTYLVTICAAERRHIFGSIDAGRLRPTPLGGIVQKSWRRAVTRCDGVLEHAFVLMPNHLHFVASISTNASAPARHGKDGLAGFVGSFKAAATGQARAAGLPTPIWQRGYYESVLEGDRQFADAVNYVEQNPHRWHQDPYR